MRKRATSLDLTLNEHGLSNFKDKVKKGKLENSFPDEKSIFDFLSLEYKKPEERKDGIDVIVKEEIKDVEETIPKKFKIKANKTIKTKKLTPKVVMEAPAPAPIKLEAEMKPDYTTTVYKIDSKNKKRQWRVWVEKNNIYTEHGVVVGKLIKSKPTEVKDEETAIKKATKMWNDKMSKGAL